MNKIRQIWKVFFTETNSHNTVQIFKSLIFLQLCHDKNITYFCFHSQNNGKIMTLLCILRNFVLQNTDLIRLNPQFRVNMVSN